MGILLAISLLQLQANAWPPMLLPTSETRALEERARVLQQVKADQINRPLLLCVRRKAERTRPEDKAMGDLRAALHAADEWLTTCRYKDARAKLVAAIRKYDASLTATEVDAIADVNAGMNYLVVSMAAAKTFKVSNSEAPSIPVEMPVPDDNDAQH